MPFIKAVPNALSFLRIAIGVAFPWLPVEWRLSAVAAAAVTDLVDGEASRVFKAETRFGQFLDPIADKTFLLIVIVTLLADGTLAWWELVLIGLRDLAIMLACAALFLRGGWAEWQNMRARILGKITTGLQVAFLAAVLLDLETAALALLVPTALVGTLAVVDYVKNFAAGKRLTPHNEAAKV